MKKRLTAITMTAAGLLCLLLLAGCGAEETAETKTIPIEFSVDEKTILVNSFANLTDNSDLNLFEEGVATLIEDSLGRIPGVKIIPRRSMNKVMAVSDSASEASIGDLARSKGADYLIDGWISKHKDEYRIYANLLDVRSGQAEQKAAVATFKTKDEAVQALDSFVGEICTKVGMPRAEMEEMLTNQYLDYNIFSMKMKAVSSYYKGRPDVAVSLLEQCVMLLQEHLDGTEDEEKIAKIYRGSANIQYMLAQIQLELDNLSAAQRHLDFISPYASRFNELSRKNIVAMNHEVQGDYEKALAIYTKLSINYPHEQWFYVRMAHTILASGGTLEEAIAVLERGSNLNPDETRLHREIAQLRLNHDDPGSVEDYAVATLDKNNVAAGNEVVSTLVSHQVKDRYVRSLPRDGVFVAKNGEKTSIENIQLTTEIDLEQLKQSLDYSCPNTTAIAFRVATVAISSGDIELAENIASMIKEKGTATNSESTYFAIESMLESTRGDFRAAKKMARKVKGGSVMKYITWAHLYAHAGNYDKASEILAKAHKETGGKDPLVIKAYVDTLWLAGNYEQWSIYNRELLELSEQLQLLSPKVHNKMVIHWNREMEGSKKLPRPESPPAKEREPGRR